MKVKYLYNSGFEVHFKKHILVFDSTRDHEIEDAEGKTVYHFCTHSHPDHYNPYILEKGVCILSNDIDAGNGHNIVYLEPYEELRVGGIWVRTFGSTDAGLSFYVLCEGKTLFHSGDLNLWYWEDDPEEVQKKEKKDYHREIKKLRDYLDKQKLDIAFVPVDRRLGENCTMAIEYFLDTINVKTVFPMHFRQDYEYIKDVDKIRDDYREVNIINITHPNQTFEL